MRFIIFILLLIVSGIQAYSQKEDHIWYFGSGGAGLDFNYCDPLVVTNGHVGAHMWEGAASIADKNTGEILFYSDGISIYNANHDTMMNGFFSALWNSVSQNIILPMPGNDNIYYLITPEVQASSGSVNLFHPKGINYAVIDMSLDGGLGSPISKFNALIDSQNCEMVAAIRNANDTDIWLITHRYHKNRFSVFKITSTGIDTVPAFFDVGPVIYTFQSGTPKISAFDAIGEIKPSPDGSKLAFTTFYNAITALFDFDNATGVISNPISLELSSGGFGGYGVSFSPDNSKLYIAGLDTSTIIGPHPANGKVFQFDISSGAPVAIQNSKTLIYTCSDCSFATAKLAPDGRIYIAHYSEQNPAGDGYLDVINFPDSTGTACDYTHNGIFLNGLKGSWGLTNYIEPHDFCRETGISESNSDLKNALIFPDPVTDVSFLKLNNFPTADYELEISDACGRVVSVKQEKNNFFQLRRNEFEPAIYFFRLFNSEGIMILKGRFIVQ